MAKTKKAKKAQNNGNRLQTMAGAALLLLPAILAAITAFMNTAFARDNGLSWDDVSNELPGSKKSKRSKRA